jgi:hypothetical protein
MEINYTNDAVDSLTALVSFIETHNTKGAGLRWLNKFELYLQTTLKQHNLIKLCHNATFKQLKLKCIYFNDWLIAFSETKTEVTIEAILHKSRIKD